MIVCHFTTVHKLHDTRVFYKECRSLVSMGYKVILVGNHNLKTNIDGIEIDPLPQYRSRFFSMVFKPWIALARCISHHADIYHFHDPELIPVALVLRLLGNKVIYDVHEDVPMDIRDKEWIRPDVVKVVLGEVASIAESVADIFMSGIVVVTEPIGKRFKNKNKILLRNLPLLKMMDGIVAAPRSGSEKVVIYIGGLTRIRGIREMILAMKNVNASLWIVGEWDDPLFEAECMALDEISKVRFFGFLNPTEAYAKLKSADVAIVNFLPANNHLFAMPNKPFEYMAMRIPFVMSDFPYWQEQFKEYALFADPMDPGNIGNQLERLLGDNILREKLTSAGRQAVEKELCWEKEVIKLEELYKKVLE